MFKTIIRSALACLLLVGDGGIFAFAQDDDGGAGLSRPMRVAVRFYEQGDDMQAMDRFMEILTKGDPSERSMANEYINLITHRMNSSGGAAGSPAPKPGAVAVETAGPAGAAPPSPAAAARRSGAPETIADGEAARSGRGARSGDLDADDSRPNARRAPAPTRSRGDDMPSENKALMRKEIRARLRNAVEKSLSDIRSVEGVRAVMRENGDPEALGIPSSLLFQSGIGFQQGASRILDPLTKLVFALGTTQAVILPEGTSLGDAKVLDMRRTMGISSHLFNAGVAPPRVKVNLLNTQVDIPKGLQDFKGVVIVFVYNQPLSLVVESAVGDDLGPPISLGVYPPAFRPSKGQGVIIEFSVSDPPAGLVSWKFQLLQPTRDGQELSPLQDVVGGGPVFHQIFWNGKLNYFGEGLPAGRYECVLTAIDAKNRQRSLHRWIQVLDDGVPERLLAADKDVPVASAGTASAPEAAPAAAKAPVLAPSADLDGGSKPLVSGVKAAPAPSGVEIGGRAAPRPKRQVVKRPVRGKKAGKADKGREARAVTPKAADARSPEEEAAEAEAAAAESKPKTPVKAAAEAKSYELAFNSGTYQLTPAAEKLLAKAAAAVSSHPLDNLRLTGHSASGESDGEALAKKRAQMVASILVNRYQVDSKRIYMNSAASGSGSKVDLEFAKE